VPLADDLIEGSSFARSLFPYLLMKEAVDSLTIRITERLLPACHPDRVEARADTTRDRREAMLFRPGKSLRVDPSAALGVTE